MVALFHHHVNRAFHWLALVEFGLFVGSFYLGGFLYWFGEPGSHQWSSDVSPLNAGIFGVITVGCLASMGLYQPHMREEFRGILLRTIGGFIATMIIMAGIFYLFPSYFTWRGILAFTLVLAFLATLLSRRFFFRVVDLDRLRSRVLVYGAGHTAETIVKNMRRKTDRRGFKLVGFVNVADQKQAIDPRHVLVIEGNLHDYCRRHNIDRIVVAVDDRRLSLPMEELLACKLAGVEVMDLVQFFEREAGKIMLDHVTPGWMVFASKGFERNPVSSTLKRSFDLSAAFILLMVAWPVMLLTVIAIWLEDGFGAPVVYRQQRVGKGGKVFEVLKMRSMRVDAEADGKAQWATTNDDRITRVGHIIRKTRIDELPQILNVLSGDMAFIGPRPERPEFVADLARQIPFYELRHYVKPGITGWAQLCYPYGASVEDAKRKLQFDLHYVKNHGIYVDFMIMLQTVEVVLFGKGAR